MADPTPEQIAATAADTRMQELVQGAVRSSLDQLVKEGQETQRQRAEQTQNESATAAAAAEAQRRGQDPFSSVLAPHIEPVLKAAREAETRANLAADAATFYTDPANAQVTKYRAKIEEVVQAQLKRGNVITRNDAWNWLRGGELYPTLTQEALTAHEAKLAEARAATAASGSTPAGPKFTKAIEDHSTDELGTALRGVSF